ncbi:GDP-L-fucose synthase [anaerobic digester metagenome]
MDKNSRIYIAGHQGMVGSAILRRLRSAGFQNLIYRTHKELDLTRQADVETFFVNEKPEYVFLAAAKVGGIVANNTFRAQFIYENLMIEANIIHQSFINGVKKLVFLGSSCIYPKLAPQPIREEALLSSELEDTNEPYAIAKIAGLKLCENYDRQYGSNFFSVMPCNLYGPNDNFNLKNSHVLSALLRKMHLAKCLEQRDWKAIRLDLDRYPIEGISGNSSKSEILEILDKNGIHSSPEIFVDVWGSGKVLREFMYVDDLADAVVFLFENYNLTDNSDKEKNNTYYFFNVGTGVDLTVNELAALIKKTTGFSGKLKNDLSKPDGTPRKLMDVSRMKGIGWEAKTKIETGVESMYQWYLSNKL